MTKKIQSALISVFYKDGLEPIVRQLHKLGVRLISTGGTKSFIEGLGFPVPAQKNLPAILPSWVAVLKPCILPYLAVYWEEEKKRRI